MQMGSDCVARLGSVHCARCNIGTRFWSTLLCTASHILLWYMTLASIVTPYYDISIQFKLIKRNLICSWHGAMWTVVHVWPCYEPKWYIMSEWFCGSCARTPSSSVLRLCVYLATFEIDERQQLQCSPTDFNLLLDPRRRSARTRTSGNWAVAQVLVWVSSAAWSLSFPAHTMSHKMCCPPWIWQCEPRCKKNTTTWIVGCCKAKHAACSYQCALMNVKFYLPVAPLGGTCLCTCSWMM